MRTASREPGGGLGTRRRGARRGRDADPVAVIEQAYSLAGSDIDWLAGIGREVLSAFDRGLGVASYIGDMSGRAPRALALHTLGNTIPPESIVSGFERASAPILEAHKNGGLRTVSEFLLKTDDPGDLHFTRTLCEPWGANDVLAFLASDGHGRVAAFCVGLPETGTPTAAERRFWSRVGAHVSAGLRLRARLGGETRRGEEARPPAPSRSARERLKKAVRAADRARGQERKSDPQGAVELWHGLVAGRWSLVDRFESGGRRFIVACRNGLDGPDPRALSDRERPVAQLAALGRSNKQIAEKLGLSHTTVATHLGGALRKLGLRGRAHLCSSWAEITSNETRRVEVLGEPYRLEAVSSPLRRPAWLKELSEGERGVALLVLKGLTNEEIARARRVSTHTVMNQLSSIFRKVGVRSRAELSALRG